MSNGRVTKRPVNSLIPLELLDSDPDHEHLPTHENPPTPTELPSEPSPETPGRPKRNPSKQYPYSPEEMANDPNEFIDNFMNTFNKRSSMFEESELQRRLDVVYAEITKLIQQRQKIEEAYSQLKEKASVFDPDPARAKPLYDLKNELIAAIEHLKERWEKVQVVSHLLWEVYDSLVQRDASRFFSRQMFENRPRPGGRINSKDFNLFVIQEETQLLRGKQGALEVMDIVPFLNPHVETDNSPYVSEDVDIHSKLDDIEKILHTILEDKNNPTRSPDIESILRKLHRIESMLLEEKAKRVEGTASQQLRQITTLIDEKSRHLEGKISDSTELIVNSMINLMTQISAILRTDQPSEHQRSSTPSETPQKTRKDRSRPPAKRPPRDPDYALLQRRLDHLAPCEKRQYGEDAAEPSQHHRCIFCQGPHIEDACTKLRSVEERRSLVRDRNLCLFCLGKTCPKPCPERTSCKYCKSRSHHYSLCPLPEERSYLEDQLAHYQH
ncbi:unnamed protein product [Cylicocyclus nassatus]|uniref:Uncharacterized protein n=1 Tax=Cylicocyclus nassatus TaxID=53992 RepID=A0AA36HG52_CYLNA|nr:unnamed protein product [Cylicocyclus nassatus]